MIELANILVQEFMPGYAIQFDMNIDNGGTLLSITTPGESGSIYLAKIPLTKTLDKITLKGNELNYLISAARTKDDLLNRIEEKQIRKDLVPALANLQIQYIDFISNIQNVKEKQRLQDEEDEFEALSGIADDFYTFLDEHNLSLFGYLEYLSRWFSGGEAKNTLIGLLCAYGTFSGVKPLWFMALGKAGEGKSFIEDAVIKMVPPKFIENGLKTEKALIRKGQTVGLDYLDGKILTMGDLGDPKDYEDYRKVMHKYKKMTTEGHDEFEAVADNPDPVTGERQTILMELKGYPSVLFTSVNSENVDDQFLSRGLTVTPVSTEQEVERFVKYMQSGSIWEYKTKDIIRNQLPLLHAFFQTSIKTDVGVINPYYECLKKWFETDEYFKRALKKYPELVKIVTYLHHQEREMIDIDGRYFYISTKMDNQIIAQLMNPSHNISGVAIEVFNKLVSIYSEFNESELEEYIEGDLNMRQCKTIFSVTEAKHRLKKTRKFRGIEHAVILNNLMEADLISEVGKVPGTTRRIYALEVTNPIGFTDIDFDEKLIEEYVNETNVIYGATPSEIMMLMSKEKICNNYSEIPFGDLEIPPWF